MNNACPECDAVYAVAEKDIGRRIKCKKCGSALIVSEEGLVRDDGTAAPRKDDSAERGRDRDHDDDDRPRRRDDEDRPRKRRDRDEEDDDDRPRKPRGPGIGEYLNKLKSIKGVGDLATWLYGIGLVLTIYSFFSPMIDKAKVDARIGDLQEAKTADDADERETNARNDNKPSDSDLESCKKRRKEFEKDAVRMADKKNYAEASKYQAEWWNVMFRLLGFTLLAFGCIGFLSPEQTQLKRILGGVTLLLILLQVIGGGIALRAGG